MVSGSIALLLLVLCLLTWILLDLRGMRPQPPAEDDDQVELDHALYVGGGRSPWP